MAYLKPKQTIFIANNGLPIYSLVEKVAFRRYRGKYTDRKTGEKKTKWKSMPYAVCKVKMSSDPEVPIGREFLIAGYKLRNVTMKGESILAFHDQYIAEWAEQYGNNWVQKMILEEQAKESKESS
tara:strand:- start:182 stop:556 length:375 start_codon:yes stop_codon:yes gene_type:complete